MAFDDAVRTLANQIGERRRHIKTEEAVKQALILPFLSLLEYDVYNPSELVPEYKAGWVKGAEKVDYAVCIAGKLAMLIEAKGPDEVLSNYDAQLAKYFNSTPEVKFALITNGIHYKFFTDLQEKNILDKQPFLSSILLTLMNITSPFWKTFGRTCSTPRSWSISPRIWCTYPG